MTSAAPYPFSHFLSSNLHLDEEQFQQLVSHCPVRTFAKGDFLLHQEQVCEHAFFIESGLAKMYGIDEAGKEHILQFAPEGWFITDRESAFFKQPSVFFIQALEDTNALLLDEAFILKLADQYPSFRAFNNRLLHNHIRSLTHRIYQLLSAPAEERYLQFVATYPNLLLRVPQTQVASYLGMTPESLSRVRRKLADKNFRK